MSSYVDKEWFYYLRGREVLVYKLQGGSSTQRISQSGVFRSYDKELMYPDESITDGLRIEYTALNEPFVAESLETTNAVNSGITISFPAVNTVSDSANGFGNFDTTDKIRIQGSTNNDGDYQLSNSNASSKKSSINIG